jgi:hypothetical protein
VGGRFLEADRARHPKSPPPTTRPASLLGPLPTITPSPHMNRATREHACPTSPQPRHQPRGDSRESHC